MSEKIKSVYFIKKLFAHLNEKIKLKLIKYNKKLQIDIDINIINYRLLSQKYIIYETKIKGKEYDSFAHHLIYDGEYLNGERSGKGKEYNIYGNSMFEDNLIFEGEYLKGKKNGKGKEYYNYSNGLKLKFEGEYMNNKIWNGKLYDLKNENFTEIKDGKGFIKEYDDGGHIIFEGEYLNGERR